MRSNTQEIIDEIRAMRVDAMRMEIMQLCPACRVSGRHGFNCSQANCEAKPVHDMLDSLMGEWADEVTIRDNFIPPTDFPPLTPRHGLPPV